MKLKLTILFLFIFTFALDAQTPYKYEVDKNGDTILLDVVRPITVYNKDKKYRKQTKWGTYYKLVYNFNKVYPYALLAKEKITFADSLLNAKKRSKREREKIIRNIEKSLFQEFEKPMRDLTIKQGAILMRLIDREVGQSAYYIIKSYRGATTAGAWQGVAKLFGSNLKKPYDRYGEDKDLEELVQMYHAETFFDLYSSIFGFTKAVKDTPKECGNIYKDSYYYNPELYKKSATSKTQPSKNKKQ